MGPTRFHCRMLFVMRVAHAQFFRIPLIISNLDCWERFVCPFVMFLRALFRENGEGQQVAGGFPFRAFRILGIPPCLGRLSWEIHFLEMSLAAGLTPPVQGDVWASLGSLGRVSKAPSNKEECLKDYIHSTGTSDNPGTGLCSQLSSVQGQRKPMLVTGRL